MSKYIGNVSNLIDLESLVNSIKSQEPSYIGPRHKEGDNIVEFDSVLNLWKSAKFKLINEGGNVGWDMYFPVKHFDREIVNILGNYLNLKIINCWISVIHPGNIAPIHWDANDNEEYYSTLELERYSIHISKPEAGHIFFVDDEVMYNVEQGSVYKWNSRKSWHSGGNFGFTNKYLLNLFGEKL